MFLFGLVISSYRFLCLDCEGERGCKGATCMHITHPRYAKKYNWIISINIPISGFRWSMISLNILSPQATSISGRITNQFCFYDYHDLLLQWSVLPWMKHFRPLPQNFNIRPLTDIAYSVKLGAEVRLMKEHSAFFEVTWNFTLHCSGAKTMEGASLGRIPCSCTVLWGA